MTGWLLYFNSRIKRMIFYPTQIGHLQAPPLISNPRDLFEAADYLGHVQCSRIRMALGELWSGLNATATVLRRLTGRQRWTVKNGIIDV